MSPFPKKKKTSVIIARFHRVCFYRPRTDRNKRNPHTLVRLRTASGRLTCSHDAVRADLLNPVRARSNSQTVRTKLLFIQISCDYGRVGVRGYTCSNWTGAVTREGSARHGDEGCALRTASERASDDGCSVYVYVYIYIYVYRPL